MNDTHSTTDGHISASFGNRKPPYSNWHYTCAEYTTKSGQTRTTRHASSLTTIEQWEAGCKRNVGENIGFGKFAGEQITAYRLCDLVD